MFFETFFRGRKSDEREWGEGLNFGLIFLKEKKNQKTLKAIFCCSLNFLFSLTLFLKIAIREQCQTLLVFLRK